MQTTWQRLAPEGQVWLTRFSKGAMHKHMTTLTVQTLLLDRAFMLYWKNRTIENPRPITEVPRVA
jgi:hypothetical protein